MISRMKHFEVISRYRQGESYRHIARELGINRKTVTSICSKYKEGLRALETSTHEKDDVQA